MKGSVKTQMKQAVPSMIIMVIMIVVASIASDRFLTAANLRNVLTQTAVLAIVSIAQCMALFIGGIDMSVSSVISISTIWVAMFSSTGTAGLFGSLVLALFAGAAVGLVNGLGVVKFKTPAMIITISTQAFVKGIALVLMPSSGGKVNQGFADFMRTRFGIFSVAFLTAVILYAVTWAVLHYTGFGRKIYAVGNGAVWDQHEKNYCTGLCHFRDYRRRSGSCAFGKNFQRKSSGRRQLRYGFRGCSGYRRRVYERWNRKCGGSLIWGCNSDSYQ